MKNFIFCALLNVVRLKQMWLKWNKFFNSNVTIESSPNKPNQKYLNEYKWTEIILNKPK